MTPTYQKILPSITPNEQLHINTFNFSYLLTKLYHLMHLTESIVAVAAPVKGGLGKGKTLKPSNTICRDWYSLFVNHIERPT